jgi:hypothetical protein
MSEKKEKQWAVLKYATTYPMNQVKLPSGIVWFDSRAVARAYAAERNAKTKKFVYIVRPMTRGPGA